LNDFPNFPDGCRSLLRKHLTLDVWSRLKDLKTPSGVSLHDCIRSGFVNSDSVVGLYAGDADCYVVFADLFAPVITGCHPGFVPGKARHDGFDTTRFKLANPDPDGKYVLSTRVRLARNFCGFNLRPTATTEEDFEVEQTAKAMFARLTGGLAGRYVPIVDLSPHGDPPLSGDDRGFVPGDPHQIAAGLCRHWPNARGIFSNAARSFFAWVNEEDHLRLISVQPGADIAGTVARLQLVVDAIDGAWDFQQSDNFGFLSSCPTNLGTGLRVSFRLRLPLVGGSPDFWEICRRHDLAVRGSAGEHATGAPHVYDISNQRRLGLSAMECLHECADGVIRLIDLEKSVAAKS
jgi:arginine kinase